MEDEQRRKTIIARLNLLAEMMERHEWANFGEKEAEEVERAEEEMDSAASEEGADKKEKR
jgi:cell division protein ZapA (FtsZ GTPase activity inhibitor)